MAYVRSDKGKKYLEKNVYEMAKERIKHTINITDEQIIGFSGGKDSLVLMNIVKEVYKELGINEKPKVFFLDEEIIPNAVEDFVKEIYNSQEYEFYWYAIPLESKKYILGKNYEYIQWDNDREWFREPPDFAIMDKSLKGLSEYNLDKYICKDLKGKVAIYRGIRTDESFYRFMTIYNNKSKYPWISKSKHSKRIINSQPIYDWTFDDIFLYFYKNRIHYCKTYDYQMWNQEPLRVATPMLAENKWKFSKFKSYDESFYDRIIEIFPEMRLNEKYLKDYKKSVDLSDYGANVKDVIRFIDDNIKDEAENNLAKKRIKQALKLRYASIGKHDKWFGGFPYYRLYKRILGGEYKKSLVPLKIYYRPDFFFEGYTEEDYQEYKKTRTNKW